MREQQLRDLATYGACLFCGAPRTVVVVRERDGFSQSSLVCSEVSAHGPDRQAWIEEAEAEQA